MRNWMFAGFATHGPWFRESGTGPILLNWAAPPTFERSSLGRGILGSWGRTDSLVSAVYLRVAGANNSIVRDARVFLASPWRRRRLTMGAYSMDLRERVAAA